ncbi:MAG: TatA/E family twin arginine-targeting protein translocase [Dehalococcoidia bacterium]|nr:TatA/E family twin arginine-targeting protein translocase [Dehalococcoidia bacterium]
MPFNIGFPEMIIILLIALIVFGPGKLPEIGGTIGKAMREFRRATSELTEELTREVEIKKTQESKKTEGQEINSYAPEQTQAYSSEPLSESSGPLLGPPQDSQRPTAQAPVSQAKES